MTAQKHAYATNDPAVLDAYRKARADRHVFSMKLLTDAAAIGRNIGPMSHKRPGGGEEIVGLKPDASGIVPTGWHLVERGKRLAPATGQAGNRARRWLVEHQPARGLDPLHALLQHGLVPFSRVENGGSFTDYRPVLFEYDDTLWVCYLGEPTPTADNPDGVTWPPVDLAACNVALTRAEAADTVSVKG